MAQMTYIEKDYFERLFDMETGYVLDFTNYTYQRFVADTINIDVYKKYHNLSKAKILRAIMDDCDNVTVGKLLLGLMQYMQARELVTDEKKEIFQKCTEIGYRLIGKKVSAKTVDTVPESQKIEFDFKKYLNELKDLADYHDNPQARGYQFERYLNRLFKDCALEPRESFRIKGEQIDGSFVLRNDIYLLEAKWTNKPTEKSDLVVFNEKVSSKSGFTRGLFISFAGYSSDAVETFCNGREVKIVLMTVQELAVALTREMDISTVIWNKVRALAEEGNYNKLVFEI
ncbi:MAG: hypothetical protein BHV95_08880 [Clostridiales bacterium Nov_37_41]|nr:MAG: hypothetical protein BHV95_08880 [Clostridiales bacterium Nov_37_41]HCI24497.1 hypothetical protein [Lachnospiraceae bacterium]